jgi:hypothetical protein
MERGPASDHSVMSYEITNVDLVNYRFTIELDFSSLNRLKTKFGIAMESVVLLLLLQQIAMPNLVLNRFKEEKSNSIVNL